MSFVHRALYTWFIVLVFLILLCLRLESRTHWNWFLIFIPLWLYDAALLSYISIKIISKWRNLAQVFVEYRWYIGAVLLKIIIQFNLCMILEYPNADYPIFLVMVPIWILLSSSIVYVFYKLIST